MTFPTAFNMVVAAFIFGATTWFFFVQSPHLLKRIGREAFVPIQMQLTVLLFNVLVVLTAALLVSAMVQQGIDSDIVLSAGLALFGAAVNKFYMIPRALRAGGAGLQQVRGKDAEGTVSNFASLGVGNTTKTFHRLVVVFVVVMLAGVVWHGITLCA